MLQAFGSNCSVDLPFLPPPGAMAPKLRATSKTPVQKSDKVKKAEDKAKSDARRKQSNMLTQLSNAKKKWEELDKAAREGKPVDQEAAQALDYKVDFLNAYRNMGAEDKASMVEKWESDKSCRKWQTWVSQTVTKSEVEASTGVHGWTTRALYKFGVAGFQFCFFLFLFYCAKASS